MGRVIQNEDLISVIILTTQRNNSLHFVHRMYCSVCKIELSENLASKYNVVFKTRTGTEAPKQLKSDEIARIG